jgi:predicted HicB family RNase H-like nuclease
MKHKGYTATVVYDADDRVFHGRLDHIADVITFDGESVEELEVAFHNAVEQYLEFCAERGLTPEKPYSGKFVLRISPAQHEAIHRAAAAGSKSINTWVADAIDAKLHTGQHSHATQNVMVVATALPLYVPVTPRQQREGQVGPRVGRPSGRGRNDGQ